MSVLGLGGFQERKPRGLLCCATVQSQFHLALRGHSLAAEPRREGIVVPGFPNRKAPLALGTDRQAGQGEGIAGGCPGPADQVTSSWWATE